MEPFIDSTPLLADPSALRRRGEEDGYLFFKQLLPKEPLLRLRRQILGICERHGWVVPGSDGLCDLDAVNQIPPEDLGVHIPSAAYAEVQRLELFHRLPHHRRLIEVYETLFGRDALPHPRCIARVILPHRAAAPTPPHQDYIHIQGSRGFWTCWFPLGDCPVELGGLAVLKGSHQGGLRLSQAALGAGGIAVEVCRQEKDWVGGDFECGDVLTFTSMTVHKAFPNQRPGMIRLSCDNRYQPADEPVEKGSLETHGKVLSWEEVYRDWKEDDLKYYWKKLPLVQTTYDHDLKWQKERICT